MWRPEEFERSVNNVFESPWWCNKVFRVNECPRECGFICPNGEMLDFSGRHLAVGFLDKVYQPNRRNLVHGNIFGVVITRVFADGKIPQLATEVLWIMPLWNTRRRWDLMRLVVSEWRIICTPNRKAKIEVIANIMQEQSMFLSKSDWRKLLKRLWGEIRNQTFSWTSINSKKQNNPRKVALRGF